MPLTPPCPLQGDAPSGLQLYGMDTTLCSEALVAGSFPRAFGLLLRVLSGPMPLIPVGATSALYSSACSLPPSLAFFDNSIC